MKPVLPGAAIGILGGGQLGRMIALEARRMGYRTVVLDPTAGGPAGQVCDDQVVGALDDPAAARELASRADLVTLEWELIPAGILETIASLKPLHPSPSVLRVVQDRLSQKAFLADNDFPQAPYTAVASAAELEAAVKRIGRPCLLKRRTHGYDGKGQFRIDRKTALSAAAETLKAPCVLEGWVDYKAEVSVILARSEDGRADIYPVAENVHRGGILHATRVPAAIPEEAAARATHVALKIADALGHVGVIAVEMFLLADGSLLVNEIAPRVHNSGHFTYGACATSQFEQHLRAVCGLPFGDSRLLCPALMVNLLGDLWQGGEPRWGEVLKRSDVKLHLYGKAKPAPGRKMGHLLLLGDEATGPLALADELLAELKPPRAGRS